jgi:glutamate/tyrosine decarboxylase-like PLP-dependent enzyme
MLAIAPKNAWRVGGLEKADSIALDPHKWLHAPFEAGCALVKDAAAHRNTFAVHPEYLESSPVCALLMKLITHRSMARRPGERACRASLFP